MKRKRALHTPADAQADIDAMPAVLRELLMAELAAGNKVVEVGHSFPAPPVGAYFKLAKPLLTRRDGLAADVVYYERNSSSYSGEITDQKRFFFLLEPARPPPPEADMDAIRAELARGVAERDAHDAAERRKADEHRDAVHRTALDERGESHVRSMRVAAFERSMVIDYDKWHDGIGYDLAVLRAMTPRERGAIEAMLIRKGLSDWRDVEALAEIDTPAARAVLEAAIHHTNPEVRNAVLQHAPTLVPEEQKLRVIIQGLKTSVIFGGLTQTLDDVADFHPPEVIETLFRCALSRTGDVAVHFAAMLFYIHGKASVPFDWDHRPFFLRFHTEDRAERVAVFRELCATVGVSADQYLSDKP
jgi:hypothetical protein